MKKETIIVFLILFQCCFILHSCTTKLVVTQVPTCNIDPSKLFAIITTESSEIISAGIYPTYKTIDQFVINNKPISKRILKMPWFPHYLIKDIQLHPPIIQ